MDNSLRIDAKDPRPIWRQIEEGVRHLVGSGALAAGSAVPSVRDLARDLQVNPATVSKAYQRLTDAGILAVRRGDGTYVAETPPPLSLAERAARLHGEALRYAGIAAALGASPREAAMVLDQVWDELHARSPAAPAAEEDAL